MDYGRDQVRCEIKMAAVTFLCAGRESRLRFARAEVTGLCK